MNPKAILYTLLALMSFILTYIAHWTFAILVAIFLYMGQRELFKKR